MTDPYPPGLADWAAASERVEELKAVLPTLANLPPLQPGTAPEILRRMADSVEALRRGALRDQIQLASLQEITESLLRGRDSAQILVMLVRYLRQVFVFEEVLLLRRLPREGGWVGFHDRRGRGGARRLGAVAWQEHWAEPLRLRTGGGATGSPRDRRAGGGSNADPADPERYAVVLPLDGRGRTAGGDGAGARTDPAPIGLLCFTPSAHDRQDRESKPLEVARIVEGVLETLSHREERESEALLRRQLLEGMGNGLLAFDRRGEVLASNAAARRLLGLPPGDGTPVSAATVGESAPDLLAWLRAALAEERAPDGREFPLGGEEGPIPVNVAVSTLRDEAGSFTGLVVNLADLSGIRSMEEEIRRLDRLAAIGRFAAGVAHEIRNPLAGIEAGVEYLAGRIGAEISDQEDVRILRSEIQRLDRIVSELLDYTRPRPLQPQPVTAREILDRVALALAPVLSRRQVELETSGPDHLILWADPDRLEQVLINLAKNAAEASGPGGRVRLLWERRGTATGACAGVLFRVSDEGPGMVPEQCTRAFEPFYSTKGGGSGLGLSLSHAIVEQHGGRLLLESAPGRGTTALLELPPGGSERMGDDARVHSDR